MLYNNHAASRLLRRTPSCARFERNKNKAPHGLSNTIRRQPATGTNPWLLLVVVMMMITANFLPTAAAVPQLRIDETDTPRTRIQGGVPPVHDDPLSSLHFAVSKTDDANDEDLVGGDAAWTTAFGSGNTSAAATDEV